MKQITYRILSIILTAILLTAILAGCKTEAPDEDTPPPVTLPPPETPTPPEVIQFSDLPATIPGIDNLALSSNILYFSSLEEAQPDSLSLRSKLYSINTDGTDLTELQGYTQTYDTPSEAQSETAEVVSIVIDSFKDIWVAENITFYADGFPIAGQSYIRKLASTGQELQSIDIGNFTAGDELFSILKLCIGENDDLYVATSNSIYVFNSDGHMLFSLDNQGRTANMMRLQSGIVAVPDRQASSVMLRTIDAQNKSWGENISLPNSTSNIFPGNDEFPFVFTNNENLYGIDDILNNVLSILNFPYLNILPGYIENIIFLPDGRILFSNRVPTADSTHYETKLIVHSISPEVLTSDEEKTELIFGARFVHPSIRPAVTRFNAISRTHYITIVDYSHYDSNDNNWTGSIDQLEMEIRTGNAPDIFDVSLLPYELWAARGEFVDLYPLIDADPELIRRDFIDSVLKAAEINGGLYQAFDSFGISTITGNPAQLGEDSGWTTEQFLSTIRRYPRARYPLGFQTKSFALNDFILMNANSFIDWDTGTAHFDRSDFTELLRFVNSFPFDWPGYNDPIWNQNLIATGRQIMQLYLFYYFNHDFTDLRETFGGEIVFKGFPRETGSGNLVVIESGLAILSASKEVEAAWEFIRMFLLEEEQRERFYAGTHLIPTNKIVFYEELQQAIENPDVGMSQDEFDHITDMINSVTSLVFSKTKPIEDIINEVAAEYFNRRITVTEATRRIQNRVTDSLPE